MVFYYISYRLSANNEGVPLSLSGPGSGICFNSTLGIKYIFNCPRSILSKFLCA